MASTDAITNVNQGLMNWITNFKWLNTIGWLLVAVLIIGGATWYSIHVINKRKFNRKITAFSIVGTYFKPTVRDTARIVKLGKGGFEVLYLRKLKIYRLAFGGTVGERDYYFFITPDGYWHNGMISAELLMVDKLKGLIPAITTNPSMRSQYTALETQIDALHENKKSFMDKWGSWVFSLAFLLIAGVLLWLMFGKYLEITNVQASIMEKAGQLLDKANGVANPQNNGLIPVK